MKKDIVSMLNREILADVSLIFSGQLWTGGQVVPTLSKRLIENSHQNLPI